MKRANYKNPGLAYSKALDAEADAARKLQRAFRRWHEARSALNRANAKLDQLQRIDFESEAGEQQ